MPRHPLLAVLASISLAAACESHPDVTFATSDDDDDGAAPTVLFTFPADGEREVGFESPITVVFSEEMAAASFDSSNFSIALEGTALNATISVSGHIATLTPDVPLEFFRDYDVSLTSDLLSLNGQTLSSAHSFTFTARDRELRSIGNIGPNPGYGATRVQVTDLESRAIATWEDGDGARRVWAAFRGPSSEWEAPTLIFSTGFAVYPTRPFSALNDNGHAVISWFQDDAVAPLVRAATFDGSSWSNIESLGMVSPGSIAFPRVAIDDAGNALAVWWRGTDVYASRFVVGAGWAAAEEIDGAADPTSGVPGLAMTPDGRAVVGWSREVGAGYQQWARSFDPITGWSPIERIDGGSADGSGPEMAIAPDGRAIATWLAGGIGDAVASWNDFTPGTGWSVARILDQAGGPQETIVSVKPVINLNGSVLFVWDKRNSGQVYEVWGTSCVAGECSVPSLLGQGHTPVIGADGLGNALVLAIEDDRLQFGRFDSGYGWLPLASAGDAMLNASNPTVSLSPDGTGVAAWIAYENHQVWAMDFR